MKTIYLVRHGQSEGNVGMYFQGEKGRLTEFGRKQAALVAQRCKHLKIDAIISSSMERAQETVKIISNELKTGFETSDLFDERRKPTELKGRPQDDPEAQQLDADWLESLLNDDIRVADGENFSDFRARGMDALRYLETRPEESLLVVTHGYFLRMLIACVVFGDELTAREFKKIATTFFHENTGITAFLYGYPEKEPAQWDLWIWNDHAHLADS